MDQNEAFTGKSIQFRVTQFEYAALKKKAERAGFGNSHIAFLKAAGANWEPGAYAPQVAVGGATQAVQAKPVTVEDICAAIKDSKDMRTFIKAIMHVPFFKGTDDAISVLDYQVSFIFEKLGLDEEEFKDWHKAKIEAPIGGGPPPQPVPQAEPQPVTEPASTPPAIPSVADML